MLSIGFASKSRTKKCNINRNFLSSSSNTQLNKNAITLKEKKSTKQQQQKLRGKWVFSASVRPGFSCQFAESALH